MAQLMAAYHDWEHYDGQDEWIGEIIQAIGGPYSEPYPRWKPVVCHQKKH